MQSIKENAFKIPQVESDVLEKYNESVTDIELAR